MACSVQDWFIYVFSKQNQYSLDNYQYHGELVRLTVWIWKSIQLVYDLIFNDTYLSTFLLQFFPGVQFTTEKEVEYLNSNIRPFASKKRKAHLNMFLWISRSGK